MGRRTSQRSVEGLHFKTLQLLESGYWDHFSELHDEPAGRAVIDTTDRHKLRNPTLGQTFPSFFSGCTTMPPTHRHALDEPSWTPSSHTCAISSAALFIPLDGKYDGPS